MKLYAKGKGHMTKMAAMPICGKNPINIFLYRTSEWIQMKVGMQH